MIYKLHEIFATRQGEGAQTGRPAVFVRFSGCNLACPWCDTDFSPKVSLKLDALLARIDSYELKSVIITGGEPLLQTHLIDLTRALKMRGYWIGIETNGTIEPSDDLRATLDYIATSPKTEPTIKSANEVRLVITDTTPATLEHCNNVRAAIVANDYFLSPCDDHGKLRIRETLEVLGTLNASSPTPLWRLSLQTHKLAGIP